MNPRSFHFPKSSPRLFAASLCCLALGGACSSDEAPPPTPITFGVEVTNLDGHPADEAVELRCDRGGPGLVSDSAAGGAAEAVPGYFSTLAVTVATTPTELGRNFVLRPAHACGASTRCGYVRIEGLDDAGEVVASVDTASNEGVLVLDLARLPSEIRVRLIRGADQEPLQNPNKTEVTGSVTPSFVVPTCADIPSAGGAGGAGSGGEASAGADNAGGAGTTPLGGAAGAGGESAVPPVGGAGGAGGADSASSGAGGA